MPLLLLVVLRLLTSYAKFMNNIGHSTDLVSSYAVSFREHQESVRRHLQGQLDVGQPLLASYLPPVSYWTSEEKDLFFHGLTIYSRLRPDLIAAHIKTKNTLDVCVYLDCLQTVASREPDETTGGYMTEPAMELSDDWIAQEDMLAESVIGLESCSWSASKDGIYPQPSCICPPIKSDIATSPSPTSAYFNHLDSICLMTQEGIIREAASKPFELDPGAQTSVAEENPDFAEQSTLIDRLSDVQCEHTLFIDIVDS
jgi:hypothetical protein